MKYFFYSYSVAPNGLGQGVVSAESGLFDLFEVVRQLALEYETPDVIVNSFQPISYDQFLLLKAGLIKLQKVRQVFEQTTAQGPKS